MKLKRPNLRAKPSELDDALARLPNDQVFQLRACFLRSEDDESWTPGFVIIRPKEAPDETPSQRFEYDTALLIEEALTKDELANLLEAFDRGDAMISGQSISMAPHRYWETERLTHTNRYLPQAGLLVTTRFERNDQLNAAVDMMHAAGAPYYPSLEAALQDWAPIEDFSGERDGRMWSLHILLPETRGWISDISQVPDGVRVRCAGTDLEAGLLRLNGAATGPSEVRQIEERPTHDDQLIKIAEIEMDWDIALFSNDGAFLDRVTSRDRLISPPRRKLSDAEALLERALESGEGDEVEFKPFVFVPIAGTRDGNDGEARKARNKFDEIGKSIAAMQNHRGGCIFLGVDDNAVVIGDEGRIQRSIRRDPDDEARLFYRRGLMQALADIVRTPIGASSEYVERPEGHVLVVRVPASLNEPAEMLKDPRLFVRRGGTNKALAPSEWRAVFDQRRGQNSLFT